MHAPTASVGDLLRQWHRHRRMSQLALALEAGISAKHVSFLESGRSAPSREMLMLLADQLDVPLRERNALQLAAGFAPLFPQHALEEPALQPARRAVELVLQGHEPSPALAIDRHWNLVQANRMIAPLLASVDASLLAPPVNVLRLSVHPKGLAEATGKALRRMREALPRTAAAGEAVA